jgi:hypothetical protein
LSVNKKHIRALVTSVLVIMVVVLPAISNSTAQYDNPKSAKIILDIRKIIKMLNITEYAFEWVSDNELNFKHNKPPSKFSYSYDQKLNSKLDKIVQSLKALSLPDLPLIKADNRIESSNFQVRQQAYHKIISDLVRENTVIMQISECVSLLKDVEQNAMSTRDAAKMLYDFFDEIYKIKFFRKIWYQLFSWDQYDLQEHYMRKLAKIGSIARKKSKKFLAKQKEVRKRKIILLDHVSVIAQGQYNDLDKLLSETTIKITKEMDKLNSDAKQWNTKQQVLKIKENALSDVKHRINEKEKERGSILSELSVLRETNSRDKRKRDNLGKRIRKRSFTCINGHKDPKKCRLKSAKEAIKSWKKMDRKHRSLNKQIKNATTKVNNLEHQQQNLIDDFDSLKVLEEEILSEIKDRRVGLTQEGKELRKRFLVLIRGKSISIIEVQINDTSSILESLNDLKYQLL